MGVVSLPCRRERIRPTSLAAASNEVETCAMAGPDPISYARSGNVAIAYSVSGEGPRDLVFAHGFAGNVEIEREIPFMRAFHDRAAQFSRFVAFDRRGTGLSDRPREPPTLEDRMDDIRAVMDGLTSERAVLFGTSEAPPFVSSSPPPIQSAPSDSRCTTRSRAVRGPPTIPGRRRLRSGRSRSTTPLGTGGRTSTPSVRCVPSRRPT